MTLKKKMWIVIGITAFIILGSLTFGFYEYSNANTDPADQKAEITISAQRLFNDFTRDEEVANRKYFSKLTCTQGILKSIDKDKTNMASLALSCGDSTREIFCQLDPRHAEDIEKLSPGDTVEVQGICAGMLTYVLLIGCSAKHKTTTVKL